MSISSVVVNPDATAWSPMPLLPVLESTLTSSVLLVPSKVSEPLITAFGESRLSVPPLSTVLFTSLSAPLTTSMPPLSTVVPIAELPLATITVPPFSTVSLVRTAVPLLIVLSVP